MSKEKVKEITSLGELRRLASQSEMYAKLAMVAASNLGQSCKTTNEAIRSLFNLAEETSEEGVVGEVNFVRDLV